MVDDYQQNKRLSCEQIIHDIKTPLSIMYQSIKDVEKGTVFTADTRESFETLKQNWLRILKLVTDASDYQKLSHGLMMPHFSNKDIVALVRNIVESTKTLSARKNISLKFQTDLTKKIMAVDKDIIDRILLNLLSNAVKFTERNGTIIVSLTESGGKVVLSVQDNGIGVSAEAVDKVLQERYFEDSPYNRSGTGMGLYIVKELVTLLNGEITVTRLDVGTLVSVNIPEFMFVGNSEERFRYDDLYSDNLIQVELSNINCELY